MNTNFSKRQFWLNHIQEYKKSRLTTLDYCQRENIKVRTFNSWLLKSKRNRSKTQSFKKSKQNPFLPIMISPESAHTPHPLSNTHLPDPRWLASLIKSLHQEFL